MHKAILYRGFRYAFSFMESAVSMLETAYGFVTKKGGEAIAHVNRAIKTINDLP